MRRWILLIITTLVLGAFPGVAQATNVANEPSVVHSMSVARNYWHTNDPGLTTACPSIEVQVEALESTEAFGRIGVPSAVTEIGSCLITISPEFWQDRTGSGQREAMLCLLITHEYGHVVGLGDVAEEGNIMSLSPTLSLVPACAKLEAHKGKDQALPTCRKVALTVPCAKRAIILAQKKEAAGEATVVSVTECEHVKRGIVCIAEMKGKLGEWEAEGEADVENHETTWPVEATVRLVHGKLRVHSGL